MSANKRKRLEGAGSTDGGTNTSSSSSGTTPEELAQRLFANRRPSPAQVQEVAESGIVLHDDGDMRYQRFSLSPVGLELPEDTSADEWQEIGRVLMQLHARIQWLLGDWLAFGEQRQWGETYKRLALEFGYEVPTLHNLSSIARRVALPRRREALSFGHHEAVASLTPDQQSYWLEMAEQHQMTRKQLRLAIREGNKPVSARKNPFFSEREARSARRALNYLMGIDEEEIGFLDDIDKNRALRSIETLEALAARLKSELEA